MAKDEVIWIYEVMESMPGSDDWVIYDYRTMRLTRDAQGQPEHYKGHDAALAVALTRVRRLKYQDLEPTIVDVKKGVRRGA